MEAPITVSRTTKVRLPLLFFSTYTDLIGVCMRHCYFPKIRSIYLDSYENVRP